MHAVNLCIQSTFVYSQHVQAIHAHPHSYTHYEYTHPHNKHIHTPYTGEEYPDVLGSILGALKSICTVIGMSRMTPPIKDLLPRLTPILKNRHEKVQENCIDLVGRIADRGAEYVPAREWMRICFELLDMLRAHKKVCGVGWVGGWVGVGGGCIGGGECWEGVCLCKECMYVLAWCMYWHGMCSLIASPPPPSPSLPQHHPLPQ